MGSILPLFRAIVWCEYVYVQVSKDSCEQTISSLAFIIQQFFVGSSALGNALQILRPGCSPEHLVPHSGRKTSLLKA